MRLTLFLLVSLCLISVGCSGGSSDSESQAERQRAAAANLQKRMMEGGMFDAGNPAQSSSTPATPAKIESGVVSLSPENTSIVFVGAHMDQRPDNTGGFELFSGSVEVDESTNAVTSISVNIDTSSLWTQISKLTTHLKSPDFLDVREYPEIAFQSTAVTAGEGGAVNVTGDLSLHGVTNEISFPATVTVFPGRGLTLKSEFIIDRTQFGMNYGPDQVKSEVSLTVEVGKKTEPLAAQGGPGGGQN